MNIGGSSLLCFVLVTRTYVSTYTLDIYVIPIRNFGFQRVTEDSLKCVQDCSNRGAEKHAAGDPLGYVVTHCQNTGNVSRTMI